MAPRENISSASRDDGENNDQESRTVSSVLSAIERDSSSILRLCNRKRLK